MFLTALTLTLQLTDAGQSIRAHELNPIVRPLTVHPAALVGVKLGTGALVLAGAHSLRAHGHKRAAFWYLVAINSVQAAVVIHNIRQ